MECCTQYFFVLYANVVLEVFKIYVGIFFWGAHKQKWLLLSVQKLMKRTMQRSPVLLLISRGFNPAGLCWAILEADTSSLYIYLRSPRWLSQIPRFFYPVWMVKESFKQTLWGEHLLVAPVAWVEHVTSTGMSSILWLVNCAPLFCPLPLLLHWLWERTICMQLVWREPVGAISVCHLTFLALCSVHSYTHKLGHPFSPLELVLGFCPYCEHAERFTVCVGGQISVVLGWGLVSKPGSLRRTGNDFLIKFLICMLIAVLLKITLF